MSKIDTPLKSTPLDPERLVNRGSLNIDTARNGFIITERSAQMGSMAQVVGVYNDIDDMITDIRAFYGLELPETKQSSVVIVNNVSKEDLADQLEKQLGGDKVAEIIDAKSDKIPGSFDRKPEAEVFDEAEGPYSPEEEPVAVAKPEKREPISPVSRDYQPLEDEVDDLRD